MTIYIMNALRILMTQFKIIVETRLWDRFLTSEFRAQLENIAKIESLPYDMSIVQK